MSGSRHAPSVLALIVLAASAIAAGDEPIDFGRMSLDEGLSQSIIERMVQDRTGFLWFATEDGLNRFDGHRFVVFKHEPGNERSLSYNELKALSEDRQGNLWVGTFENGLNRFDPSTETATRYLHDPKEPSSLGAATVRCVLEDSLGRLWVGTQGGGLDLLDRATGGFIHHRSDPNTPGALSHDDVRAIFEDRAGTLWVGTNGGGLNRLDPGATGFTVYRHDDDDPTSLADDRVLDILEDRGGALWVATYGGGLDRLDRATGRFQHHRHDPDDTETLSHDLVTSLCEDHEGTLWVGTDGGGLNRYDRTGGTFASWRHDPVDRFSLSSDRIYSLLQDRSRVLWVGTYGGGLSFFDVSQKGFRTFRHDPDDPDSLSQDIVWSFHEDPDGVLWIGTDSGGLNRFDRASGHWRQYRHDPDDPSSLSHDTVRALLGDREGRLWIATNGGGLDRLDRATGRFSHLRHDPDDPGSLGHDQLRSVMQDRDGAIWIGTFGGGLDRIDPATGAITHHRHDPDDPTSISHDFIRLAHQDRRGRLWVGTQGGGLNRLDPDTTGFVRYRHDPADPTSLSADHVFAILESADGTMWFGTFGGGLSRLDDLAGSFTRFREPDGLASDSVYALLEDERGRLWVSSTKGLSRFDPTTGEFRNFDVRDGLQSNEFNGGAALRTASGEMLFGGIGGFNAFFPPEIGANQVVPEVVITDLQLANQSVPVGAMPDGRTLLERPITFTDQVVLSHRDQVLTLEFAALHYSAPGKNRYAYRMEGFSDDWVQVSADRRFATFTGLRPGSYTFTVRGSNADGVWNEEGATLGIIVTPPFWATWWFRILALSALAGIAVTVARSHLRGVRMRTELAAAHDAQTAIMPRDPPEVPGIDIAFAWIPAFGVGGDFYDHFWLEGEPPRLCLVLADVAGKGMRAAMNAVMSDGMVFSRARQAGSVEEIMDSLNRSLFHKVGRRMFTALCLVVLDPENRELTFANAGLCEPLLRSGMGTDYLSSVGSRFPLGVTERAAYRSAAVPLAEGDVVVLFTDGVPEARDRSGELYGYERAKALLHGLAGVDLRAEEIVAALVDDVHRFCGGTKPSDDIAVVVIAVKGPPRPSPEGRPPAR